MPESCAHEGAPLADSLTPRAKLGSRHRRVMTDRLVPLIAFAPAAEPAPVLRAGIERGAGRLSLRYVLGGPVRNVRLSTHLRTTTDGRSLDADVLRGFPRAYRRRRAGR